MPTPILATPSSVEIEAARQALERIYLSESAAGLGAGSAGSRAANLLIKGTSAALLTAGIWAAMEQPAGLPELQEQLAVNGPRGMFDRLEQMVTERGGDAEPVRALRSSVMGMLDSGRVHSAGIVLGETLEELQRGGLISSNTDARDSGFDAALRYALQHPATRQEVVAQPNPVPAPSPPLAGSYTALPQPPALAGDLQQFRDAVATGGYANSQQSYDAARDYLEKLAERANGLAAQNVPTIGQRDLQLAADELDGRRFNSVLGQYVRNAAAGEPLPSSGDMRNYLTQVRNFDEAVQQRYGQPMFGDAALDRVENRLMGTIGFREDYVRFLDRAQSGQFANSPQQYEQGLEQLEAMRLRANALGNQGIRALEQGTYDETLFQIEGRRIHSVSAYVGRQLEAGQPVDPDIAESLADRAEDLNARRRRAGGGDLFDAATLDTYRDRQSVAEFREDYRAFGQRIRSGEFANSAETYDAGLEQLERFRLRGNAMAEREGVQPLPRTTFEGTALELEGRRIDSLLSQGVRDHDEGRAVDPEAVRTLLERAQAIRTQGNISDDLFDREDLNRYRALQQATQQETQQEARPAPPSSLPGGQESHAPQPDTPGTTPTPETPETTPTPETPQRDIQREWGEQFGNGELGDSLRREAERQGVSQEDVIDYARRNPDRTTNEILSHVRDGNLGVGGTPPGNRPPGSAVAAAGEPDDSPPLDNVTIVRPAPGASTATGEAPSPDQAAPQMQQPQPIQANGRGYDIVGVVAGEQPALEVVAHNAVPRFVPADALVPRPSGEPHPDAQARQVTVVQTDAAGAEVRTAYDIVGVRSDGLQLRRQGEGGTEERVVAYNDPGARVEFSFPNGATYTARQTIDGSVRFDPVDQGRTTVPLTPGMQFEARLQGRETEGPYRIEVGADYSFTARSTDPARQDTPGERISLSDIAPTWQRVTSTAAPEAELFVDSAAYQRAAQRSGRDGEPPFAIGTIGGDATIQHGFANQIYRPVLEALRNPETTGDVSIAMYGIGTSREGRQYTDALLDYAQRNPDARVAIHSGDVQINGMRGTELREWLAENRPNIQITEPQAPSNFRVPHEKIIAIGDQVFIGSEKIGMSMSRKVGFMVELGAEDAQLMHRYIGQLGDPQAPASERREVLNRLSERGVLIDDPVAGVYPNTAAMNRTLTEAQDHLRIYQSDLTDTVATQRIIDRARDGIDVDLRYREIDPQSLRMLQEAQRDLPNLRHQQVPNDPLHPIYQHENYVISERGGVLSSSYMWEPKAGQVPRYTNGGEGGVLLDAQQAGQYERYLDNAPTRQIGPGAILDLTEEAWSKLSPRLFEQLDRFRPEPREGEPPAAQPREQTPPTSDNRRSSVPDAAAPSQSPRDPGLDDARHPNHTLFASALDRIQAYERGRGIESGDFARNLAGDLTVRSVETGLPRINHVVFNAEGTRAFAVDTPNLDAEWRRVAYTDVAAAGQQTLAASSERLRELQPLALSPTAVQQDMQQRPDEQARNAARMV